MSVGDDTPELAAHADEIRRRAYAALAPARRAAVLRPAVERAASALLAAVPDDPVDLVASFAAPLAEFAVGEYLGLPDGMWPRHWRAWWPALAFDDADAARDEVNTVLRESLTRLRRAPDGSVLAAFATGGLPDDDVLRIVPRLARNAALGVLDLTSSLARCAVGGGASGAPHDVVEEVLRLDPPVKGVQRVDLADGSDLVVHLAAANRDPAVFRDPDVFDPSRTNLTDHLSFGRGRDSCVGAPVARTVGLAAWEALSSVAWQALDRPVRRRPVPLNAGLLEVWAKRRFPRTVVPG